MKTTTVKTMNAVIFGNLIKISHESFVLCTAPVRYSRLISAVRKVCDSSRPNETAAVCSAETQPCIMLEKYEGGNRLLPW